MDLVTLVESVGNFGILLVIAAVFLWDHVNYKNKIQKKIDSQYELLHNIKETNLEIFNSLGLIEKNVESNKNMIEDCKNNDCDSFTKCNKNK